MHKFVDFLLQFLIFPNIDFKFWGDFDFLFFALTKFRNIHDLEKRKREKKANLNGF